LPDTLTTDVLLAPVLLSVLSVTALVGCDLRGLRWGRYLFKPLAAAAFIWLALALGAIETSYGLWMLAAFILCMVGDISLMFDSDKSFLTGLGAFLCGHLLFAIAFTRLPMNITGLWLSVGPALVLLLGVAYWLRPHVPQGMRVPVALYVLVITAMLLCAGLTAGQSGALFIIAGAWGFAASDLAVARRQFVTPSALNSLWGLPLYFGSQMVLAASIAFA